MLAGVVQQHVCRTRCGAPARSATIRAACDRRNRTARTACRCWLTNCTLYFLTKWLPFIFGSMLSRLSTQYVCGISDSPMWNRGKLLALEQLHPVALLGDQRGDGRAGRAAADDDDIKLCNSQGHPPFSRGPQDRVFGRASPNRQFTSSPAAPARDPTSPCTASASATTLPVSRLRRAFRRGSGTPCSTIPANPLIVQGDRSVLVEVDNPRYAEARDALAPFAELEKSPEHIHTYRLRRCRCGTPPPPA